MAIFKDELYSYVDDGKTVRITASIPLDLADIVRADRDVVVLGNSISVSNEVDFGGKRVTILCREIAFGPHGILESNGRDSSVTFPPGLRAASGVSRGEAGSDGADGGDGAPGGAITLVASSMIGVPRLRALGGQGGRGQDGGSGAQGIDGPNGTDANPSEGCADGSVGGDGNAGGKAGDAGISGAGGNGGTIRVISLGDLPVHADLLYNAGMAGALAYAGDRGAGGIGGKGGRGRCCDYTAPICKKCDSLVVKMAPSVDFPLKIAHRDSLGTEVEESGWMPYAVAFPEQALAMTQMVHGRGTEPLITRCSWTDRAGSGRDGGFGQAGQEGRIRHVAAAGSATIARGSMAVVAPAIRSEYPLFLLQQAEAHYQDSRYAEAAKTLRWLMDVCATMQAAGAVPMPVAAANTRARVLLAQMSQGLDYFGNARNFVPLASLDYYANFVAQILPLARDIEASYNAYFTQNADATTRRAKLLRSLDIAGAYQQLFVDDGDRLAHEAERIQATVKNLSNDLETTQQTLLAAADTFKHAVANKANGGCEFADIIKIGMSVYAVANGAWPAVLSLKDEIAAVIDNGGQSWGAILQHIEVIGKDVQTIGDAYGKIKGILADPQRADLVKIAQSRADFEEMIKPYLDMPEAQAYRNLMFHFLETSQARNNKIVEYTAVQLRYAGLISKLDQSRAECDSIRASLSQNADPGLPMMLAFMTRAYRDLRRDLAYIIYQENRALEYWGLTESHIDLQSYAVAQLEIAHAQTQRNALTRLNSITHPTNHFDKWQTLDIRSLVPAERFAEFLKTGVLHFTIHPETFTAIQGFPNVRISQIQVLAHGAKTDSGSLTWHITHAGLSTFYGSGAALVFSHLPRTVDGKYQLVDGEPETSDNLTMDGATLAPSPFATWQLALLYVDNPGLRLDGITDIQLGIKGTFFG